MIEFDGVKNYTREEAAKVLGVHFLTIGKYIRDGKVSHVRVGHRYYISEIAIRDFLAGKKTKKTAKK